MLDENDTEGPRPVQHNVNKNHSVAGSNAKDGPQSNGSQTASGATATGRSKRLSSENNIELAIEKHTRADDG